MDEDAREQRRRQTRDRIASVALALFCEHGYDQVSVADVAATAGVTERTVFNHFRDKASLVFDEAEELLAELLHSWDSRPAGADALEAVSDFVAGLPEWTETRRPPRVSPGVQGLIAGSADLRSAVRAMFSRWEDALRQRLVSDGEDEATAFAVAAGLVTVLRAGFQGLPVEPVVQLVRDGMGGRGVRS